MQFNIVPVTELAWPFSRDSQPVFYIQDGTYRREEKVDPYPCYAHPVDRVAQLTKLLNDVFPIDGKTDIYLPAYETPERVNGWASQQHWYNDDEKDKFGGTIVLAGKRIPLHPAMTRYLVVHEFGHIVQYWLEKKFNLTNLITAYAKDLRGMEDNTNYYGGRTWHLTPGEVFANDFRIAACGTEVDFWPHDVPHPHKVEPVLAFWEDIRYLSQTASIGMAFLDQALPSLAAKQKEKAA